MLLVSLIAIPVGVNVLTFGIFASALAPAALPDWDNPFGNRQSNEGRGIRLAIIALVGMVTIVVLSLPIFPGITPGERERVASALATAVEGSD